MNAMDSGAIGAWRRDAVPVAIVSPRRRGAPGRPRLRPVGRRVAGRARGGRRRTLAAVALGPERRGPRLARCWEGRECVRLLRLLRFQRDGVARRAGRRRRRRRTAAVRRREAVEAAGELVVRSGDETRGAMAGEAADGEKIMTGKRTWTAAREAFGDAWESFREAMVKAALGIRAAIRAGAWRPTGLVKPPITSCSICSGIGEANDEMGGLWGAVV